MLTQRAAKQSGNSTGSGVQVRFANISVRQPCNVAISTSCAASGLSHATEFCMSDSCANQTTFGPCWETFDYADRYVTLEGFKSGLVAEDLQVCCGLGACTTEDRERVLLNVNEGSVGDLQGAKTLLSKSQMERHGHRVQMERHGHRVNDSAKKYGGAQNILLHDGTELPI